LLAKADRAAAAAAAALGSGAPDLAAARAFGAMLSAAKAVLCERGVRLRTHARIAAALARVDALPDPPVAQWLADAIARRHGGEAEALTFEEAGELVSRAAAFVAAARRNIAGD
jgi:uncharacterized protein (UPF0332 family)